MHTIEHLVTPLNKSATFFQAPCSIKLMCDYENNDKLQSVTTEIVHDKMFFMLIFEWTN